MPYILLQRADEVMLFAAPRRSIPTPSDIDEVIEYGAICCTTALPSKADIGRGAKDEENARFRLMEWSGRAAALTKDATLELN